MAGRRVFLFLLGAYFTLPLVATFLYSIATSWTDSALPNGYTPDHWLGVFTKPDVSSALVRSLTLSGVALAIDLVLVLPAAYWAVVRNPRVGTAVQTAAIIPFAIPWVVIAAGLQLITGAFAPELFGTFGLLAAATAAIAFPFLYWAVTNALIAADAPRLSEAAATCGAHPMVALIKIVIPAIKAGIVSGSLLVIATAMNEFAMAMVLVGNAYETLPIWSARQFVSRTSGDPNALAVITLFTFGFLFAISAFAVILGKARTSSLSLNQNTADAGRQT